MRRREWCLAGAVALTLICATACSDDYQPPNHTYTGGPEYYGVGVSVWNGQAAPVLIGGPPPVAVPKSNSEMDVPVEQMPLDPVF